MVGLPHCPFGRTGIALGLPVVLNTSWKTALSNHKPSDFRGAAHFPIPTSARSPTQKP